MMKNSKLSFDILRKAIVEYESTVIMTTTTIVDELVKGDEEYLLVDGRLLRANKGSLHSCMVKPF